MYSLMSFKYLPLAVVFILNGVFDEQFSILCYHFFLHDKGFFGSYLRNLSIFLGLKIYYRVIFLKCYFAF